MGNLFELYTTVVITISVMKEASSLQFSHSPHLVTVHCVKYQISYSLWSVCFSVFFHVSHSQWQEHNLCALIFIIQQSHYRIQITNHILNDKKERMKEKTFYTG